MGRLFCLSLFSTKPRTSKAILTFELSKDINGRVLSASTEGAFKLQGSDHEIDIPEELYGSYYEGKNRVYEKNKVIRLSENLYSCEHEFLDAALMSPSEEGTSCSWDCFSKTDGVLEADTGRETLKPVSDQDIHTSGCKADSKNGEMLNLNSFLISDSDLKGEYTEQSSLTSPKECMSAFSDGKSSIVLQCVTSEGDVVETGNVLLKDGVEMKVDPCNEETVFDAVQTIDMRVKQWMNQSELDSWEEGNVPNDFNSEIYCSGELQVMNASNQVIYPKAVEETFLQETLRSLRGSKTAHLSAINLHVTPSLGMFSSLKIIDLSGNLIARISAGCFPRRLHTLNLSRNRISQIEGLRELTHLRVLDLSHNRLMRIGHGLSNCTHMKELYLGGNKIGEIEGLHRLLKLVVLDLNNNKLDSTESINQLAANYGSLLALDLLGNPILQNVDHEKLLKFLGILTPHVAYFNKQAIKAVSARDIVLAHVARAALGTRRNKS